MAQQPCSVTLQDVQRDALRLLRVHYVAKDNKIKYEDIERMIRDKTSLKVIWKKWSHCNWQNLLQNAVGAVVMWQLFHNHANRYDEFFGDDNGSSDTKEEEGGDDVIQHSSTAATHYFKSPLLARG